MRPVLVLHGGAGLVNRATLERSRAVLRFVLDDALAGLLGGGSSLDAVTAAVVLLEDSGLFNAGRGASLNTDGTAELDASVMDGRDLRAGAVAAVSRIGNPVLAARAVMEHSRHVLLAGKGAEEFCLSKKIIPVKANYFSSRRKGRSGTVGAVALDRDGNLAAATSTGGYWGKLPGRVGDSPLIGAGTWADNRACAVSCTGTGEYFMRTAAAHDVAARMLYLGRDLQSAASGTMLQVKRLKGTGGMVAVDRKGGIAMPFNTPGMYRAWADRAGRARVETD
jgi:isoaspartyl peptidase/L-asparaginase-like protein (Ntn-hydrolase superfamily)